MQQQQNQLTNKPSKRRFLGACSLYYVAANTGSWRLEKPVVNPEVCVRCGICSRYCPADCITVNKEGNNPIEFDFRYCKGCGICVNECPKKALELVKEGSEQ